MTSLLEVTGLTVEFGGVRAVDDVDAHVDEGELVGLIGPNGAGKTTLVNALTGFVTPSSGRVLLGGRDVTGRSPVDCERAGLRRTFQSARAFAEMTTRENLATASSARFDGGLLQALLSPRGRVRTLEAQLEMADELIQLMGLGGVADDLPGDLDHSQLQFLSVGMALAGATPLVCLDEPFAGLSPEEANQLRELIDHWHATRGTSFLIIDHALAHLLRTVNRVICLDSGRVLETGSSDQILRSERVRKVYLG